MRKAAFALVMIIYILYPISAIAENLYYFPDYEMQIKISDDWIFAARGEDKVISNPKSYPDFELGNSIFNNIIGYFEDEDYKECVAIISEQDIPVPGILLLFDIHITVLENEYTKEYWDFSMYYEDDLLGSVKSETTSDAYIEIYKTANDTYIEGITGSNTLTYLTANNGRMIKTEILAVPLSMSPEAENSKIPLYELLFEKGRDVVNRISFIDKRVDPNIGSRSPIKYEPTFEERRSMFCAYTNIIYVGLSVAIAITAVVCSRIRGVFLKRKRRNHIQEQISNTSATRRADK